MAMPEAVSRWGWMSTSVNSAPPFSFTQAMARGAIAAHNSYRAHLYVRRRLRRGQGQGRPGQGRPGARPPDQAQQGFLGPLPLPPGGQPELQGQPADAVLVLLRLRALGRRLHVRGAHREG